MTIITLTTDFGLRDGYVAALRGVILGLAPTAIVVDVTHEVTPGAIREAGYVLSTVVPYYPPSTVHVAVVDPGVGSARRPIAAQTVAGLFVGPDNGLFTLVLGLARRVDRGNASPTAYQAVHLTAEEYWWPTVSATFHGRDIFAPVAAHLARGVPLESLGLPISDLIALAPPEVVVVEDSVLAHVLHIDRFGNLITSLRPTEDVPLVPGRTTIEIAGHQVPLVRTYSDVPGGALLAYLGSSGHLEIAVRDGSAAPVLGAGVDTPVVIRWRSRIYRGGRGER